MIVGNEERKNAPGILQQSQSRCKSPAFNIKPNIKHQQNG